MVEPVTVLFVDALLELPHKCVHTDDSEDQPEDNTHGEHVEDTESEIN
jgi:hypothetical protein